MLGIVRGGGRSRGREEGEGRREKGGGSREEGGGRREEGGGRREEGGRGRGMKRRVGKGKGGKDPFLTSRPRGE
jgi:hypothetical protein